MDTKSYLIEGLSAVGQRESKKVEVHREGRENTYFHDCNFENMTESLNPSSSYIPRGVPAVSYVRVLTAGTQTTAENVEVDGSAVTVFSDSAPRSRHDGMQIVLPRGLSDVEVCEQIMGQQAGGGQGVALNPISAFVGDSANSILLVNGSKSTRKANFMKRTFLPFVANEVMAQINERDQTHHDYNFHATIAAYEIQDEVITDLIRPSSRGLNVSVTADDGVVVAGLHKERFKDEMDLRRLLFDSCENRASHVLPLGASIHTSVAVWEINLNQLDGAPNEAMRRCSSRLLIIDLPCVDVLTTITESTPLESVTLHKSLIAYKDVIHRLQTPAKAALAPFRTSMLTHILSELLGGNALVVGLGIIAGNDYDASKMTLALTAALGSSVHYPVGGRELTDIVQGLLSKYRAMVLQLQDEIRNGAPVGEKAPEISEKVVTELQRDLAEAQLDRNLSREDRQRIFEMMELLKAKYKNLLKEKTSQSQELIKAEEDKLSIARALVELKLEYSAKQEQAEKEKFEITSALLAAKNEIFDLDSQLLLAKTEGSSMKEGMEDLEKKVSSDLEDMAGLRATLQEVREQYQRETDKNLELGAELLTLVNQKSELQRKVDEQQQRLDVINVKLAAMSTEEKEATAQRQAVMASLNQKEDENSKNRRVLMEQEMDLKRLRMEIDHMKQDIDRREAEYAREKEAATMLLREAELKAREAEKHKGKHIGGQSALESEANSRVVKLEQKNRDLQREVKRARSDEDRLITEKNLLDEELQRLRETYRQQLSVKLNPYSNTDYIGVSNGATKDIKNNDEEKSKGEKISEIDEVLRNLMTSFNDREQRQQDITDGALANARLLKCALRTLFDKYQATLDAMEEHIQKKNGGPASSPILDEQMLLGEASGKSADSQLSEADAFEQKITRERLARAETGLQEEQDRMAVVLNTFKRALNHAEAELAESKRQCAELAMQVQQLVRQGPRPPSQTEQSTNTAALKAMQEQLMQHIRELKESSSPNPETIPGVESDAVAKEREQQAFRNADEIMQVKREMLEAKVYIGKLEANAPVAVLEKLREVEGRAASLRNRSSSLEVEIENYQKYMKETVLQYKRQIQMLRSQLATLRGGKNLPLTVAEGNMEKRGNLEFPSIVN